MVKHEYQHLGNICFFVGFFLKETNNHDMKKRIALIAGLASGVVIGFTLLLLNQIEASNSRSKAMGLHTGRSLTMRIFLTVISSRL